MSQSYSAIYEQVDKLAKATGFQLVVAGHAVSSADTDVGDACSAKEPDCTSSLMILRLTLPTPQSAFGCTLPDVGSLPRAARCGRIEGMDVLGTPPNNSDLLPD